MSQVYSTRTGAIGDSKPSRWRLIVGIMILLLGIALLAPPEFYGLGIRYEKLGEWQSGDPGLPEVGGTFPIDSLTRYRIERLTGNAVELNVARYQDASAIVFPAQGKSQLRHDLWQSTADAIKNHSDANALFLSWWDDGQRIQFLTGRQPWLNQPVANAFPNASQKALWEEIGGGFNPDETRIKQFARWLSMDADAALAEMDQALPKGQPVYWLASLDDLARLSEIEALSGVKLPFEARVFPAADNLHSQIAAVQRWADEHGSGSYLVQQLQGGGAMVWRITNEAGEKTLLARLLPFTSSLAKPLERLSLVYQSAWGGYLSVYQWQR